MSFDKPLISDAGVQIGLSLAFNRKLHSYYSIKSILALCRPTIYMSSWKYDR